MFLVKNVFQKNVQVDLPFNLIRDYVNISKQCNAMGVDLQGGAENWAW